MGIHYTPESALVIMAHPDDIEFLCAGTLARWVADGAHIAYVLITSGEVGISIKGMSREKASAIREEEQRQAAAVVGVDEVIFLNYPDGMLEATLELRKKLVREIRRFKPEVVMCGDPTIVWSGENYINHPDHRAAASAALDAAFPAAGQPNLFEDLEEEGLQAHKPRKVYVSTWKDPDTYVNIEETLDMKLEALRAHKSQYEEMSEFDPEESVREWAHERGKGKEMAFAESFRVVTLETDKFWNERKGRVQD